MIKAKPDTLNTLVKDLADVLLQATLPLFTISNGRPDLEGSGTLVNYQGHLFLVSAAHVLDKCKSGDLFFYGDTNTLFALNGSACLSRCPKAGRDDDHIDVGVLMFSADIPKRLKLKHPIPYSMLKPINYAPSQVYLALGYPASKGKPNPVSKTISPEPLIFWNSAGGKEHYARLNLDPSKNILIKFNKKQCVYPGGLIQSAPDPYGISGGPIWFLYDHANLDNDDEQNYCMGVLIEWRHQSKLLVGTNIHYAQMLIAELLQA